MKIKIQVIKMGIAALIILGAIFFAVWLSNTIPADHWGFSISINFLFMAVFTFIFGTLFTPKYTSHYFKSKPFEREGSIYIYVGVKYYIYLLRMIGWEKIIRKENPIKNNIDSLLKYDYITKGSETVHLVSAIFVAVFTLWIMWKYSVSHIHWLVISNVIFNVYPVILQRYNRPRVNRLLKLH